MPVIKVTKPFSLRLSSDQERHDFGIGKHFVSDEELAHWFMQACLKDGRADLVPDEAEGDGGQAELVSPTKEQLMKLNRDKLVELAVACGITVPEDMNKGPLCDLLLAGQEGVTLVKGPDGIFVQKAE